MSSLQQEMIALIAQTKKLIAEYQRGDSVREKALRDSIPKLMELITQRYELRQYPEVLQIITVLQLVGKTLGIGRVEAHALTLRGVIQHILGLFYEALGNYQKAVAIYNQENYDPGRLAVLHRMGDTFLALLRYEQALGSFDSVLRIKPAYIPSMLGKASALELMGRDAEAVEWFRKVLAVDPQNKQARQGLTGLGVT